jgi:hypothetical protein
VELGYSNIIVPSRVVSQIISTKTVAGCVTLTHDFLLRGEGKREEDKLSEAQPSVVLALRFRKATMQDCMYFSEISSRSVPGLDHAGDT